MNSQISSIDVAHSSVHDTEVRILRQNPKQTRIYTPGFKSLTRLVVLVTVQSKNFRTRFFAGETHITVRIDRVSA